jgi:signal transduction histidine kinase
MTTITADMPSRRLSPAQRMLRQLGIDTAFVLAGFPLAIAAFVVVVTLLATGAGMLITVVGLPILVAALYTARGFAHLERLRIRPVLHRPPVPVSYRRIPPDAGFWRRMFSPLSDGQMWLDALYSLVRLVVSTATFSIAVTWWSAALGGASYWFWQRFLPPDNNDELPAMLGFGPGVHGRIVFYTAVGVFCALTLPLVLRWCALAEAWLAYGLLNGLASLRHEISGLTVQAQTAQAQRVAAMSAEATALHRLERDIHDGPQQRLVRLAVDLGRARQQLDGDDPAAARSTVDEALAQARETLDELRTLSRGIAPPVLTDRGLAAAVAALAARSTIPVTLDIPTGLGRLHPLAEQTAYFTIAEALTNVAKHSGASAATVSVASVADRGSMAHQGSMADQASVAHQGSAANRLEVTVSDNGNGGAHLAKGHGLAGLADRVHSAGGELWVSSPDGGPTRIRVELPCPTAA